MWARPRSDLFGGDLHPLGEIKNNLHCLCNGHSVKRIDASDDETDEASALGHASRRQGTFQTSAFSSCFVMRVVKYRREIAIKVAFGRTLIHLVIALAQLLCSTAARAVNGWVLASSLSLLSRAMRVIDCAVRSY